MNNYGQVIEGILAWENTQAAIVLTRYIIDEGVIYTRRSYFVGV